MFKNKNYIDEMRKRRLSPTVIIRVLGEKSKNSKYDKNEENRRRKEFKHNILIISLIYNENSPSLQIKMQNGHQL
jgi:hypothetical protein